MEAKANSEAPPLGRRSRLVDDIQSYIREGIYSGKFPQGTRLRQEQLAAELQVSRTPLREALRVLENEGLVSLTRGHGAEVIQTELGKIRDACLVREVLDGLAARLAAEGEPAAAAPGFESSLEHQRASLLDWDKFTFTRADADLHVEIIESTGNSYLIAQSPLIRMTSQVFHPAMHYDKSRAEVALAGHERIVEAILAEDPVKAEAEARAHVRLTIDTIQAIPNGGRS